MYVNGTSATVEPRVLNPQDGADKRRGDIKVSKHGNTWICVLVSHILCLCIVRANLVCVEAHRMVTEISAVDLAVEASL